MTPEESNRRLQLQVEMARLRAEAEAAADYDAVFGSGAYNRMMEAKEAGCIVVTDERRVGRRRKA